MYRLVVWGGKAGGNRNFLGMEYNVQGQQGLHV